jgi:tetratricopeptide (TPR) repeat protein
MKRASLAALSLLFVASGVRGDVQTLREQANKALRSKSYGVACPLYAKVRDLTPDDSGAWADLGLCLGRSGKRDEAVVADQKAIWLGDAKTRLNVYFNLAAIGSKLDAPDLAFTADGDPKKIATYCTSLGTSQTCAKALTACSRVEDDWFAGNTNFKGVLVFGLDRAAIEAAQALKREKLPGGTAVLELSSYFIGNCRKALVCGTDPCLDDGKCKERGWGKKCQAKLDACNNGDAQVTHERCAVVFADACRGLVGVVCGGKAQELVLSGAATK